MVTPDTAAWPPVARQLLAEHCHDWAGAVALIASRLEDDESGVDPVMLRHDLQAAAAGPLGDILGGLTEPQRRALTDLAAVAPVTTSELVHILGDGVVPTLRDLARARLPMVSRHDELWRVAPLLRDRLLHLDPTAAQRRSEHALTLAERCAVAGAPIDGLERILRSGPSEAVAAYVGRWSIIEALRGFPHIGSAMLRRVSVDDATVDPDLLLAAAMVALIRLDLPAVGQWCRLLETHHTESAQPWSSADRRTSALIREAAGLRPTDAATAAAASAGMPWSGLGHIMLATDAVARGDDEQAAGALAVLRSIARTSPLIAGWRVALLLHELRRSGRVDEAVALYGRVLPDLQTSPFAAQRITFFLDAAMGRAAALAGQHNQARELMARSLDKVTEVRGGAYTTRMLVHLTNAETAYAIGDDATAKAAVQSAADLAAYTPEAGALLAWLAQLQGRSHSSGGPTLTAAQLRVLHHLESPYPVPQIARLMFVSPATVRTHIRHLYAALEVSSRGAAVDRARTLGLLD